MRVLVAGAGPVGLAAALTLARRGIAVTVLEAGETLAAESRASTFHPPTLEMLADLGVLDEVEAIGLHTPTFAYRDRYEGVVAELDLSTLAADTRYPYRIQLEQSKLTPILARHLREHPTAEVRYGFAVRDVVADAEGVTVTSASGEHERGDWLIGADGAHSAVRRSLGIAFDGITYPERFLVASTEEDLTALLGPLSYVNYVFDPDEWCVLLRTPDHWRVLLPTPPDTPDEVELDRLDERLRGVADPGRPWKVAHASIYRVHQRVAATFRLGRVLLAGDAAHVNNPLGGLGMNSGIHDAVAFATALAAGSPAEVSAAADVAAADRRRIALEYVQQVSHTNYERLRSNTAARAAHLADLRTIAADRERTRAYLFRSSMLASLRPPSA